MSVSNQDVWALLQIMKDSASVPVLKPIHDNAMRQLVPIAQDMADAWAKQKVKDDADKAAKTAAEVAKAQAASKAQAAVDAAANQKPVPRPAAPAPTVDASKPIPLATDAPAIERRPV